MPPTTRETRVRTPTSITPTYETLSGIPDVDIPANVHAALAKGRRATGIAAEAAALRFGPGRLCPQEYFVCRLWDSALPLTAKPAFVGKLAQHPMHVAAGSREWNACSADKILFHMIMAGVRFRVPDTIAITQSGRHLPDVPTLDEAATSHGSFASRPFTRFSQRRSQANTASRSSAPRVTTCALTR